MVIFKKVAGHANCGLKESQTTLVSSWCKRAHRFQSQGLHFTTRSAGSSIRADRPLSCSFLQKCFTSCSLLHHFLGQVLFSRVRAKTCVILPDMSRALRPKTVQNLQCKTAGKVHFRKKSLATPCLEGTPSVGLPSSSMARPISFPSFPAHHKVARRFGQILTERWLCLCNFWIVLVVVVTKLPRILPLFRLSPVWLGLALYELATVLATVLRSMS